MRRFQREVFVPTEPTAVLDRLGAVLEELPRANQVKPVDAGTVEVRTGWSKWSWGEVVTGTVAPAEGGTVVRVRSRSRVWTTFVDYDQNRRTVKQVLAGLGAAR